MKYIKNNEGSIIFRKDQIDQIWIERREYKTAIFFRVVGNQQTLFFEEHKNRADALESLKKIHEELEKEE